MKTTDICKTESNENEAWFRSPFIPSGQETDQAYSTTPTDILPVLLHVLAVFN